MSVSLTLFLSFIFQLEYFTSSSPGHWITVTDIGLREKHVIEGINGNNGRNSVVVVVRARNNHGLSLPSPAAKIQMSSNGGANSGGSLSVVDWSSPPVELLGARAIGPKKIRVEWQVK